MEVLLVNSRNNGTLLCGKAGNSPVPDLVLDDSSREKIGIYGRKRERYLKEHHPSMYSYMLLNETLYLHLLEMDEAVQNYLEAMIPRMASIAGLTEEQKSLDRMAWEGWMSAIRSRIEEFILIDLIYR